MEALALPAPWIPLTGMVPQQRQWANSPARFNVIPAGRRSQKTWLAKRKLILKALVGTAHPFPTFFAAAPTWGQCKAIFWRDLKAMLPPPIVSEIRESDLQIDLINGSTIMLFGLDRPERIEGRPIDGGVIDEVANCKPEAWPENIRPALADRNGWCDMIGVPEGMNHYYDLAQRGISDDPENSDWATFSWWSEAVLPAHEIEAAKRDLPEQVYRQEYQAEFLSFSGRAYYAFDRDIHVDEVRALYQPGQDLILCLDFNTAPGVAVICQELIDPTNSEQYTAIIGEVWIERGSDTQQVMQAFLAEWGGHPARLEVYGDQTGGAGGAAQLHGSNWDIVQGVLDPVFQDRLWISRPGYNPSVRARINALNVRLRTLSGRIRLKVDPTAAPHTFEDLERVTLKDDGKGDLDKRDQRLTHLTDALGYYIFAEHPMMDHAQQVKIEGF